MFSRQLFLALIFITQSLIGFTQSKIAQTKLQAVVNGLTETRKLVFADSAVPKYNILDRMNFYKVPSVSIAVINNGTVEWAKAFGYADIGAKRLANANTLYQAASISKSINAFAVLRLVQEGKLSLDTDIRNYLKTWTFPDNGYSTGKVITIKSLLSHTAGLSTSGFIGYKKGDSIPDINQILNGEKPANSGAVQPILLANTEFRYSGGGITIVRKILNDNISSNYDSLVQALCLRPVGMINSTFSQPLISRYKNFAAAYDAGQHELQGAYYVYPELAPDGLWTTATDVAKFVISIQHSLQHKIPAILSDSIAAEMVTPPLSSSDIALGTFVVKKGGEKYFSHSGANMGYRSVYYGSFGSGKGVVILTNSDNGQALINEIINSVAIAYQWKGFYEPMVKKLVKVRDTLLDKYVGDYANEMLQLKISVVRKGKGLELTSRQTEKLYATGLDTFFLASAPDENCIFSSSKNDGNIDTFEVKQGATVVLKAMKQH